MSPVKELKGKKEIIVIRLGLDQLLFHVITYLQRIYTQLFTFLEHIITLFFFSGSMLWVLLLFLLQILLVTY